MNRRLPLLWLGMGMLLAACSAPSPNASRITQPVAATVAASTPTRTPSVVLKRTPAPASTAKPHTATDTPMPTLTPSAPTPTVPPAPANDFGPAPELRTETWLNTDQPLRLADLRGQVVLVDFWTFG